MSGPAWGGPALGLVRGLEKPGKIAVMLAFRLVFGLLLFASLFCFAMSIGTGNALWRRRGILVLKWALIAALGFFGVLVLERLAVML